MKPVTDPRPFTGRHLLFIMLAFFGVIISVNLTMAFFARSSWTGLVVQNSYVASQEFNAKTREARAQTALGWQTRLEIAGGHITYSLADANDRAVATSGGIANFRRPVYAAEDETVELALGQDGSLEAPHRLRDGIWIGEFLIDAGLEHPYRDVRRFVLRHGVIQ
jgi:nitrogen fixation protein FixH